MNPPIKEIKTSLEQLSKMDDGLFTSALATYDPATKQHTIYVPYRASTKTRLHEIAHCELGHCQDSRKKISVDEYIEMEVDADEWAFSKCGKTITLPAITPHARSVITDYGISSHTAFSACIKALAKHGYNLDREQRSELWWACREFEKERREY